MGTADFILIYVQSCTSGKLGPSDCGPIWHFGIIVVLLLIAVITLAVLRLRPRAVPERA